MQQQEGVVDHGLFSIAFVYHADRGDSSCTEARPTEAESYNFPACEARAISLPTTRDSFT